jgi:hypothetical protein
MAKALTIGESSTVKVNGMSGRSEVEASSLPMLVT